MDFMTYDNRIYYFGKSEQKIEVANGGYLSPDRIKHYEDIYGPLYSVKYHGKITICEEEVLYL